MFKIKLGSVNAGTFLVLVHSFPDPSEYAHSQACTLLLSHSFKEGFAGHFWSGRLGTAEGMLAGEGGCGLQGRVPHSGPAAPSLVSPGQREGGWARRSLTRQLQRSLNVALNLVTQHCASVC